LERGSWRQHGTFPALTRWQPLHSFLQVEYVSKHRVEMEWDQLRLNGVEGFQWAVENKPQEALSAIGIAAFSVCPCLCSAPLPSITRVRTAILKVWAILCAQALFSQRNGVQDEDMVPPPRRRITPRILNYKPVLPMKYLKSNRIGKFVTLTGTVRLPNIAMCLGLLRRLLCTELRHALKDALLMLHMGNRLCASAPSVRCYFLSSSSAKSATQKPNS
jgi:hypothetical protein